jgi:hypothetical protein
MAHRKVCAPTLQAVPNRVRPLPAAKQYDPGRPRLVQQLFWRTMEDGWRRTGLRGVLIETHTCGETRVCEADALGNRLTRPVPYTTMAGALRALEWKVID